MVAVRFLPLLASLAVIVPAAPLPVLYVGAGANVSLARTTVDAQGNIYAIGSQIVTVGSYTARSVFVTKIDPMGSTVFNVRWGGKGDDIATGIGVDATGRIFCAGYTASPDFPLLHQLQTNPSPGGTTGFVFALDSSGQLLWSTYFGGSAFPMSGPTVGSSINALVTDAYGNTYVTGTSQNPDLLTTEGAFQRTGDFNAIGTVVSNGFVAKFSSAGQLVYSTWLAGSLVNCNTQACGHNAPRIAAGTAITLDKTGAAYIAGYTDNLDFPTTPGAFQTKPCCIGHSQSYTPFLTKLKPDGSGLVYSTLLGSFGFSQTPPAAGLNHGLAIDADGNAYLAFGTTGPFTVDFGGNPTAPVPPGHVSVVALNATGAALDLSVTLGGTANDSATGLVLDPAGNIYISGTATSPDFPDRYKLFSAGADFLTELNPTGDTVLFSARLPGGLAAQDIALSSEGTLVAAGMSGHVLRLNPFSEASFPTFLGAGNAANGGIDSGFTYGELISLYGTGIGPSTPVVAIPTPVAGSLSSAYYPESLGGVKVMFNGIAGALFYVSANQINVAVPLNPTPSPVIITISNNGVTLGPIATGAVSAVPTPGIFRNADGSAAILNQDGTLNTLANPAHAGSIITFWGTGIPALVSGLSGGGGIPSHFVDSTARNLVSLSLLPGSFAMPVLYAGGAPGLSGGIFQINARVSQSFSFPGTTLSLESGGVASPPVPIYVAP